MSLGLVNYMLTDTREYEDAGADEEEELFISDVYVIL